MAKPLIAILLVAGLVSGLTGDRPGFGIILGIVAVSVAMDVVQEHRAEQAAALRDSVAVRATARRGGCAQEVAVESLVTGDVVELTADAECRARQRRADNPGRGDPGGPAGAGGRRPC